MMLGFGFLVLLVVGGVVLVLGGAGWRRGTGAHRASNEQRQVTPRELLDQRLARGEIDQAEYEATRGQLES